MLDKFKKIDVEIIAGVVSFIGLGLQIFSQFLDGKVEAKNDEQFKNDMADIIIKKMKEQKRAKK